MKSGHPLAWSLLGLLVLAGLFAALALPEIVRPGARVNALLAGLAAAALWAPAGAWWLAYPLAVLLAIVSSLKNKPLQEKMVVFGEVGLAGEVRPVQRGQERLKEAAKLGFTHAIIPKANAPKQAIKGMEVIALERVEQAVETLRSL